MTPDPNNESPAKGISAPDGLEYALRVVAAKLAVGEVCDLHCDGLTWRCTILHRGERASGEAERGACLETLVWRVCASWLARNAQDQEQREQAGAQHPEEQPK